jgi:hypothetical protein
VVVVLVNVPLKLLAFEAPTPFDTPAVMLGMPQVYMVPIGTGVPVGFKLNTTPEQVVSEVDEIMATGSTVTVTVKLAPLAQPAPGFGVTV